MFEARMRSVEVSKEVISGTEHFDGLQAQMALKFREMGMPNPDPNLRLCVSVAAAGEWGNDNFFRLLRSYSVATKDHSQSELVVVVGSPLVPTGRTDSKYLREIEGFAPEDQRTLQLIRWINRAKFADHREVMNDLAKRFPDLSVYERRLVSNAVRSSVNVVGVDGTMFPQPGQSVNLGKVFNVGVQASYWRLNQVTSNGVIDLVDADCTFSPGYVDKILGEIEGRNVDFIIKPVVAQLQEYPRVIEQHPDPVIAYVDFARRTIADTRTDYLVHYLPDILNPDAGAYLSNYQMGFKASALRKIGGYPHETSDPDFELSSVAFQAGLKPWHIRTTQVNVSDRGRESSIDGKGAGETDVVSMKDSIVRRNEEALRVARMLSAMNTGFEMAVDDFGGVGLAAHYKRERKELFEGGVSERQDNLRRLTTTLRRLSEGHLIQARTPSQVVELDTLSDRERDYFQANPVVAATLIRALGSSDWNPAAAVSWMGKVMPEYFKIGITVEPRYSGIQQGSNLGDYIHLARSVHGLVAAARNQEVALDGQSTDLADALRDLLPIYLKDKGKL